MKMQLQIIAKVQLEIYKSILDLMAYFYYEDEHELRLSKIMRGFKIFGQ